MTPFQSAEKPIALPSQFNGFSSEFPHPIFAVVPAFGRNDLVTALRGTPGASDDPNRPTRIGKAYATADATNAGLDFGTYQASSDGTCTVIVMARAASAAGICTLWSQRNGTSAPFRQIDFFLNANSSLAANAGGFAFTSYDGGFLGAHTGSGFVDGGWHVYAATRPGSFINPTIWFDGIKPSVTTTGTSIGSVVDTGQKTRIGNLGDYTTDATYVGVAEIGIVLVYAGVLSDRQMEVLTKNPARAFNALRDPAYLDAIAGGGGTTIDCTPGNAVAAGTAATINQAVNLACTPGNATAAGTTATISTGINLVCTPGAAVASGITATINAANNIACAVGNATAAGISAVIELGSGIDIVCTPGNAVAAGIPAVINEAYSLGCTVGNAVAAGTQATIDLIFGTIARPSSDVADGAWLPSTPAANLFDMIDETAADDLDYIYATSPTTCSLGLGAVSDPLSSTGHVIRYRAWAPTTGGLVVKLKQGATVIATWTHATLPTSPTTYEQTLSGAEADSITDYAALRVDFESTT